MESGTPVSGKPTHFTIDTRAAGEPAPVDVVAKADGEVVPVKVDDLGNGLYECSYTPESPVKHTIIPTYDGVAVKDSPFRVRTINLIDSLRSTMTGKRLSIYRTTGVPFARLLPVLLVERTSPTSTAP